MDKLKEKIIGLINFIYLLYFSTGFFVANIMLKDATITCFSDRMKAILMAILTTIFWLPIRIVEILYK